MISLDFKPDRWKHLRQGLFRNKEPEAKLVAITKPVGPFQKLCTSGSLAGFVARQSRESKGGVQEDIGLIKNLLGRWPVHGTPLQAVNFVFHVDGTTKSLQAQWTRHKIGVGWVYRSTRYVAADKNHFIYPTYDYLDDEGKVKKLLEIKEARAKVAVEEFGREIKLGSTKEDARRSMPLFYSTPCFFFANARALRHLFSLRLDKTAEWEIRRMTKILLDICIQETPAYFEDFVSGSVQPEEV